jgi:hypothetical protein
MIVFPGWLHSLRVGSRAAVALLSGAAVLLAIVDWLPANNYVDPDPVEFVLTLVIGLTAVQLALRTRVSRASLAAWRRRALLIAVTAALALSAAEAATRYIFRHVTTSADAGSYFSRRWLNDVQFNVQGFRAPEVTSPKPAGTYRIAVIGDSFTFGNGLAVNERYSDRLAAWLPEGYEVLNFGTGGANTPQHLDTLTKYVLPATPDYVLLQWYVNDIEGTDVAGRPHLRSLFPAAAHTWFNRRSALYVVANIQWIELQVGLGLVPSYAGYLEARAGDPNSADARRDAKLLREFITTAQSRGSEVGLVLFPDTGPPLDANYSFGYLHDRVLRICAETGITCLDLRRDFAAVKDRRSLWVSPFDHHPSAKANELAALKIMEVFRPQWSHPRR